MNRYISIHTHTHTHTHTSYPACKYMSHLCVQALKLTTEDVKEEFIRGSGRGGQAVNKTSNKVRLTHVPTGLKVVMCITCE